MSQSSPIVQEPRRGKRPRSAIPITPSFLNDSGDDTCSACEKEADIMLSNNSNSNRECITVDLAPSDYFRLALTITDPTTTTLHLTSGDAIGDYTTQCLIKHARRLAVDQELGLNVILMLHPLMANYYKEGISKLIPVMKKTGLHKARELRFVQACLGQVRSTTFDLVMEQFKQCVREAVDLGKVIMSDIRYARLLPLLCFLRDVSSGEAGDVIQISQSDSQSQPLDAENYHVIQDSDYEHLESSGSIIDITQESYGFVIAPSMPDYSSYHSPSLNEGGGGDQDLSATLDSQDSRAIDPFGQRYSSQTPDRTMSYSTTLNIPSPVSKEVSTISLSILDSPSEISISSSVASQALSSQTTIPSPQRPIHHPSIASQQQQQQQQQQKRLTDYEELSTAELKAKLKSFGFKTSNSRPQMIQDLKHIQMTIDNQKNSQQQQQQLQQQPSTQSISSLQSLPELNGNSQVRPLEPNKKMKIIQHLRSRPEIWQNIAMYNTVSIDECMIGIRCKRGEMKMVLDEFAAAKGTNKRYASKK